MIEKLFIAVLKDITNFTTNLTDDVQTKFMKAKEIDAQNMIDTIVRIIQSGKILSLNEKLKFSALIIHQNAGGAGGLKRVGDFLYKKKCVVRIKTEQDDKLCALRAIFVGISFVNKDNYEIVRDSRNGIQRRMALKLASDCYLNINEPICFNEIKKVEDSIKYYQIIVINGDLMNEILKVIVKKKKLYYI